MCFPQILIGRHDGSCFQTVLLGPNKTLFFTIDWSSIDHFLHLKFKFWVSSDQKLDTLVIFNYLLGFIYLIKFSICWIELLLYYYIFLFYCYYTHNLSTWTSRRIEEWPEPPEWMSHLTVTHMCQCQNQMRMRLRKRCDFVGWVAAWPRLMHVGSLRYVLFNGYRISILEIINCDCYSTKKLSGHVTIQIRGRTVARYAVGKWCDGLDTTQLSLRNYQEAREPWT